jgi:hypothetical protein
MQTMLLFGEPTMANFLVISLLILIWMEILMPMMIQYGEGTMVSFPELLFKIGTFIAL